MGQLGRQVAELIFSNAEQGNIDHAARDHRCGSSASRSVD